MITELFNTWEEKWNRIPNAWKTEELIRIGVSPSWVYFVWDQGRHIGVIRVDRDTIQKLDGSLQKNIHGGII